MLDKFLSSTYRRETATKEKTAMVESLKKLPNELLAKLASGETKLSYISEKMGDEQASWLDKFRGTPLAEQALALEQESISAEMENMQKQQQRRAESAAENSIYDIQDQIRLKKKLLELQLYQLEVQGKNGAATVDNQKKPPVPEAGLPGNGAMGPEAENSEENMNPVGTPGHGNAKTGGMMASMAGAIKNKLAPVASKAPEFFKRPVAAATSADAKELVRRTASNIQHAASKRDARSDVRELAVGMPKTSALIDSWGRQLARADMQKSASTRDALRHRHMDRNTLKEEAKKNPGKIRQFVAKHPKAAAAVGALAGAASGVLAGVGLGTALAKNASLGSALGSSLNGGLLGKGALLAMKHPGAAGAAVGAVGGAIAGGPDNRLGGALGGAALGGAAGHAGAGIAKGMAGGASLGQAAKSYGSGLMGKLTGPAAPPTMRGTAPMPSPKA